MELLRKQSQDPPPLPRTLRPDLPEPAEAVIWQALSKQPEERFASATAFAQAFSSGLNGQWEPGVRPIAFPAEPNSQYGSLQWTRNTVPPVSWSSQTSTQVRRRSAAPAWLAVIALVALAALVLNRDGLGAFFNPSSTPGTQVAVGGEGNGSTPTVHSKSHAPTATPHRTSNHPVQPTTPPGVPTNTAVPIPLPTATATTTPIPQPTATSTPCPYLNGGNGVTFYSGANYTGNSWNWYVAAGNVNAVANLSSNIAGNLGSFADSNSAWHVVLYQGQNGTGNLGHYDNSWPNVDSYWKATQSVKIYLNRSC